MIEIISVRFKSGGKQYYFNPNGIQFQEGDGVIVETTRGQEYAQCVQGNTMIDEIELTAPLRPVVRLATAEDATMVEKNKEKEKKAFSICQEKIAEHGLDMKLVSAEYSFDGSKVLFFFTSEGRVDFRALVKDLASAIHARIELRQIGVRDEAKMLGGLGICGRPFCCSQFLDDFQPVSIKMAKTQNLSLNPTKISGTCGRLMCCLKYEQDAYEDLVKTTPKQESFVETPDGAGTVCSVNLLRQTVQVRLDSAPETPKCIITVSCASFATERASGPRAMWSPLCQSWPSCAGSRRSAPSSTRRSACPPLWKRPSPAGRSRPSIPNRSRTTRRRRPAGAAAAATVSPGERAARAPLHRSSRPRPNPETSPKARSRAASRRKASVSPPAAAAVTAPRGAAERPLRAKASNIPGPGGRSVCAGALQFEGSE